MVDTPTKSAQRQDPLPAFCFCVTFIQLGDVVETFFKSVSGLRSETEVIPVRVGGANDTTFNLFGGTKWSPLVLKQGFMVGSKLLEWREKWVIGGKPENMVRSGGTIVLLDTAYQPKATWQFFNGWPSKWEMGEFDASKSELAIETLEISHDGIKSIPTVAKKKK